jgi:hypothetical protein
MASTATDVASIPSSPAGTGHVAPAPASRRLASAALDAFLLGVGLAVVLGSELAIATEEAITWVAVGWTVAFAPLYFGLYHAYGTGATPGQLELRIGLRDAESREVVGLGRSLARAYLGFLFLALVVPAVIDLAMLATGRSLRDRLTVTVPVGIALSGKAPELAAPTIPEFAYLYEPPAGTRSYLSRGWALLWARPRLILGPVAALSTVLVGIAALVAVLLVDGVDEYAIAVFGVVAPLLLVSGVYWAQAVVVTASEQIRVGADDASTWGTLVRASRRVNALTTALLVLLALALLVPLTLFLALLVAARLTLVAPALVLEDTRVLGAFRRSWQLTRGQTWKLLGLLLLSYLVLGTVIQAVGFVTTGLFDEYEILAPALVGVVLVAAGLVVAIGWLGAAWSLVYEDSRRAHPAGGDR